jgi:hypothetical protein
LHRTNHPEDPVGDALGELLVPSPVTAEDMTLAVRAIAVHASEDWPTGPRCRNDGAPHPCRLARWGHRVLRIGGFDEGRIVALVEGGDPDATPAT